VGGSPSKCVAFRVLPERCHHRTGRLSSCSLGLQSLNRRAPGAALVWRSRPGLLIRRCWPTRYATRVPATQLYVMPPSSLALQLTSRDTLVTLPTFFGARTTLRTLTTLPWGLAALRRFWQRAATYTRLTEPSCAASSGFLNLSTLCSARNLPGFISRR
jgi:hypothetical protein